MRVYAAAMADNVFDFVTALSIITCRYRKINNVGSFVALKKHDRNAETTQNS